MLDIRFVRENPDVVKENIKKKFQDEKIPMVDEVIDLDAQRRDIQGKRDALRAERNKLSKENGPLFGALKKAATDEEKAEIQAKIDANMAKVKADEDELTALENKQAELEVRIQQIMPTA